MNDSQALKLAVMYVMETDLMRKPIDGDQEITIYTDEGQPVDVLADKMVQRLRGIGVKFGWGYATKGGQHGTPLILPLVTII